jgi:hypothetical protein
VLVRPFIKSTAAADCCLLKAKGTLQHCPFAIGLLSFISFLMFCLSYSYPFPPTSILLFFFVFSVPCNWRAQSFRPQNNNITPSPPSEFHVLPTLELKILRCL